MEFQEMQRFRQSWLLLVILIPDVIFLIGFFYQIVLGRPFGDNPMSDSGFIFIFLILLSVNLLIFSIKLSTRIDSVGVSVRFYPFHLKPRKYNWTEISKAYIRKYNPILEYGGWGIRFGLLRRNGAYNISGNMGLQLELNSGNKILIGTQKPDEIEEILKKLKVAF